MQRTRQRRDMMKIFHGAKMIVSEPSIKYSRQDIDFGLGFYLTADEKMAKKWACSKYPSFINLYEYDPDNLNIYQFSADKEWLDFVVANRNGQKCDKKYREYDVLAGPTADDKLFVVADLYIDGLISTENAIKVINSMNYSLQIVFKSDDAIRKGLSFISAKELKGFERDDLAISFRKDTVSASQKARELIAKVNRGEDI